MASSNNQTKSTPPLNLNNHRGMGQHTGNENIKSGIVGTSLNGPLVTLSSQGGTGPSNNFQGAGGRQGHSSTNASGPGSNLQSFH